MCFRLRARGSHYTRAQPTPRRVARTGETASADVTDVANMQPAAWICNQCNRRRKCTPHGTPLQWSWAAITPSSVPSGKSEDLSEGEGGAFVFGGESRVLDGKDEEGSNDNAQANASSVVFPPDDEVAAAAVIPALDTETVAQSDDETDSCDICGSSSDDDDDSDRGAWTLGGSGETWKLGDISRLDKVRVLRGGARIVCGETWSDKTRVLRGGARIFCGDIGPGGEARLSGKAPLSRVVRPDGVARLGSEERPGSEAKLGSEEQLGSEARLGG
jgi:hypothetical protein